MEGNDGVQEGEETTVKTEVRNNEGLSRSSNTECGEVNSGERN